jgi:putative two-component system response regulator
MMPDSDIDGLDVCRRLKADPVTADIAIILLSAKSQKEDIEAGLAAGAVEYMVKPFSPVALLNRIGAELTKKNKHNFFYSSVPLLSWS